MEKLVSHLSHKHGVPNKVYAGSNPAIATKFFKIIMNRCLYCGKIVKNKYCNVSCQNRHQGTEKANKNKDKSKCNSIAIEQLKSHSR